MFTNERSTLCSTLRNLENKLIESIYFLLTIFYFSVKSLSVRTNLDRAPGNATIEFILSSKSFDDSLFITNSLCSYWIVRLIFILFYFIGCSMLVGQHPMKSLSTISLSVYPSPCTSLSFLKIGSLVISFFWYCTWWQLTKIFSDRAIFLIKKLASPVWAKWAKSRHKFRFFAIFSSLNN